MNNDDKLHVATVDLTTMRYLTDSRPATEEETLRARFNERGRAMEVPPVTLDDALSVLDKALAARGRHGISTERCAIVRRKDGKVEVCVDTFEAEFIGTLVDALAFAKGRGLL